MNHGMRMGLACVSGCALLAGIGMARHLFVAADSAGAEILADDMADAQNMVEPGGQDAVDAPAERHGVSVPARPLVSPDARPALASFVDPQAEERLPADFHYQVDRVEDADEVAAVVAVLRNRSESDTIRHEAANLLRRSGFAGLEQVLIDCVQHPDERERFRSWVVQHLFMVFEEQRASDPQAAGLVLVPLLEDPQPAVRREALLSLHRLESSSRSAGAALPDVTATAAAWLSDPATVDLALRILRERDARAYLPQVRAVLADDTAPAPARIAAIVTLSAWGDHESRAAIAKLANLPDQPAHYRLRRSAQMALERFE